MEKVINWVIGGEPKIDSVACAVAYAYCKDKVEIKKWKSLV